MFNSNEIYEPSHFDSENMIVESYYDNDTNDSTASSSNSVTSKNSVLSSNSVSTKRESIKQLEFEKFTDLELVDDFVSRSSANRDSTKPVCIFLNKLEVVKHKMLQQTRKSRSKACKISNTKCDLQFKYQRCEKCKVAVFTGSR